ncbi:MAG: hypothetical protein LIP02_14595 [Bacteroidales bacterium]|nr:hypothetical protein [Bacteroidales bacterium]
MSCTEISAPTTQAETASQTQEVVKLVKAKDLSASSNDKNKAILAQINRPLKPLCPNPKKKAEAINARFFAKDGSMLIDDNVEIKVKEVAVKDRFGAHVDISSEVAPFRNPALCVTVHNKTGKMLFIDLGNSFFTRCGQSFSYYNPTSTSTSHTTGSGASLNLGAAAGALGISGAGATLASGITIGAGSSDGSTTTVYNKRVITLLPDATYTFPLTRLFAAVDEVIVPGIRHKYWVDPFWDKYGDQCAFNFEKKKVYVGNQLTYLPEQSPISFGFTITYSPFEDLRTSNALQSNFYLGEITGLENRQTTYSPDTDFINLLWFVSQVESSKSWPYFPVF